jgi:hypothetical protein
VSIETKIAREVPLTRPRGDQETAVQLLDLGVEVRRLEKEFALIQALLENKTYWPKEDRSTQTNNKRRSGTCGRSVRSVSWCVLRVSRVVPHLTPAVQWCPN